MSLLKFSLPEQGDEVLVSLKRHSLTMTVNRFTIVTFDRAGRWLGAFLDGKNYKRGIDNRVMEKWAQKSAEGFKVRYRRDLVGDDKKGLVNRIQGLATRVLQAMRAGRCQVAEGEHPDPALWSEAEDWLARVVVWDHDRLEAERERFLRVYKPIPILPPDQYLALVLQITEGCTYNRCTFCDFYRGRPFRIKPLAEVREHIVQVKELFASSMGLRHVIFLADANALVAPPDYMKEVFILINQSFDIVPPDLSPAATVAWRRTHPYWFRGIYSFLDVFTGHHKGVEDFRTLHQLGLQRVYIGLETGDPDLLAFLNKPGSPQHATELIQMLLEAGVHVGVIVMVGVGGERFSRSHVEKTVQVVNSLKLGRDDLIYLSVFVEHPQSDYAKQSAAAGIRPLSSREIRAQMQSLRAGFRFDPHDGPKVALYDIQEFIY